MQLIIFAQGQFGQEITEIMGEWIHTVLPSVEIIIENLNLQTAIQIAQKNNGFCVGIITPEIREMNIKKISSEYACLLLDRVWKHEIKTGLEVLEFNKKGMLLLIETLNQKSEEKMDSVVLRKRVKSYWDDLDAKCAPLHREYNRQETEYVLSRVLSG